MGMPLPPKGKHLFGMVTVGDKGQIVIPAKGYHEIRKHLSLCRCSQERNSRTVIDNEAMDMFLTAFK